MSRDWEQEGEEFDKYIHGGLDPVGPEEHPCPTCALPDDLKPSHNGSRRCESGSIASGGTKAHCSCDLCF